MALSSEKQSGAPVLNELLRAGAASVGRPGLETIRIYTARAVSRLPAAVRKLREPATYPVTHSDELNTIHPRATTEPRADETG